MNVGQNADSTVLLEVHESVATIVLNRPERHNSLIPELLGRFADVVGEVAMRPDIKIAVLSAAGKSFSTGGDVKAILDSGDNRADYAYELVDKLNDAIASIIECDKPIIAAVDGRVSGGSIGLVLACDITVVTEHASFTPYYVDVGLSPDGGWTALLPHVVGHARACAVQLLNHSISAEQAVDWGIAYVKVASENLSHILDDLCARLLDKKAGSIRATKQRLRLSDYRRSLDEERRLFVDQVVTQEATDGIQQFLSNRN